MNVRISAENLEKMSNFLLEESSTEKFDIGKNNLVANIDTLLTNVSAELNTAAKNAPITNPRTRGFSKITKKVFRDAYWLSSKPSTFA